MTIPSLPDPQVLARRLAARAIDVKPPPLLASGTLTGITGLTLEAAGCALPLGARCRLRSPGSPNCEAEVVGFRGGQTFLMPVGDLGGLRPGSRVIPAPEAIACPWGRPCLAG